MLEKLRLILWQVKDKMLDKLVEDGWKIGKRVRNNS